MQPSLHPPARPGFWWSPLDPVVLLLAVLATHFLWVRIGPAAGVVPLVVGHYFLFCNVVRMRPWREAVWALATIWQAAVVVLTAGTVHWLPLALAVLPITAILVVDEVREPGYRGAGAAAALGDRAEAMLRGEVLVPRRIDPRRGVLVMAGVFYAAYGGLLYVGQDAMLFPFPTVAPEELAARAAAAGGTELRLTTADGVRIYGWHRAASTGRRRAVIYCHGNGASVHDRTYLYDHLAERGWDVLAVSYRGYPGSEGAPSEAGIEQDVRAFWDYAVDELGIPPERIVLHGLSLGGGAVGTVLDDVRPGGVVLEGTFASVEELARRRAPIYPLSLLLRHPFRTIDRVGEIRAPALVVHGSSDETIPVDHGRRLAAAIEGAEYVEIDGAGHGDLVHPGSPAWAAYDRLLDAVAR